MSFRNLIQVLSCSYYSIFGKFFLFVVFISPNVATVYRTNGTVRFTVDDLTSYVFPHKISSDIDIDPCKAGKF